MTLKKVNLPDCPNNQLPIPDQKHSGFLAIPHFIKRVILLGDFTMRETKIIMVIIEDSIGWGHPYAIISRESFEKRTGIARADVSDTIKKMKTKNLIFYNKVGRDNQFHINFEEFKRLDEILSEQNQKKFTSKTKKMRGTKCSVGKLPTQEKNESKESSVGKLPILSVGKSPTESVGKSPTQKTAKKPRKINDSKGLRSRSSSPIEILIEILNISLSSEQQNRLTERWKRRTKYQSEREIELFSEILRSNPGDFDLLLEILEFIEATGKDFNGKPVSSVYALILSSYPIMKARWYDVKQQEQERIRKQIDKELELAKMEQIKEYQPPVVDEFEELKAQFKVLYPTREERLFKLRQFHDADEVTFSQSREILFDALKKWKESLKR